MAEQFDHRDLIITLCQKGFAPAHLPGRPGELHLDQFVEVNVRAKDGRWHQVEIPLEEFYDLMFRKVFPSASRRLSPFAKSQPKK
jgi:hypothetical protein